MYPFLRLSAVFTRLSYLLFLNCSSTVLQRLLILFHRFKRFRHIDFVYVPLHKAVDDNGKQHGTNESRNIAYGMNHVIESYHIYFHHTHNGGMEQLSERQTENTCNNR